MKRVFCQTADWYDRYRKWYQKDDSLVKASSHRRSEADGRSYRHVYEWREGFTSGRDREDYIALLSRVPCGGGDVAGLDATVAVVFDF